MFKPTNYQLENVGTGRIFSDEGWTLADPESPSPSLVRAVYEHRQFNPREELKGLYRYADWMPIQRPLHGSSRLPVSNTVSPQALSPASPLTSTRI